MYLFLSRIIMAEWRISEENPVRELEGLDYERCAALHNYIVELGWTQRGLTLDTLDKRTWWECHGGDAALTSVSNRLEAAVISFLKLAWHGFSMETASPPHFFHRYSVRLCFPDELWQNLNYAEYEDDSNKRCFVTLYMANGALGVSYPQGLILDQDYYGMAMQHMSIHDTSITMNGRQTWLPLETILDGFIDMIDHGKILAVGDAYNGGQERTAPWIMPSYTQRDLDDTLEAFQQLVNTIHNKMPSQPQDTETGLLNLVTGGHPQTLPSNSFAYHLLTKSPIPSFTYIAPGLRIAQHQPFASALEQADSNKLYPLLLFSSTHSAHQETICSPWGDIIPVPLFPDFNTVSTYPAGLYLTETEPCRALPFEDGCRLALPFLLGANAFARTGDDALIGEDVRRAGDDAAAYVEPRSTELYQLGFNPLIAAHDMQLKHVLWNWVAMVEEGKWEVDADGVVGGIEKWREADTEEHWSDYQLPMTW
jgi:hypothetical protein